MVGGRRSWRREEVPMVPRATSVRWCCAQRHRLTTWEGEDGRLGVKSWTPFVSSACLCLFHKSVPIMSLGAFGAASARKPGTSEQTKPGASGQIIRDEARYIRADSGTKPGNLILTPGRMNRDAFRSVRQGGYSGIDPGMAGGIFRADTEQADGKAFKMSGAQAQLSCVRRRHSRTSRGVSRGEGLAPDYL